MRKEQAMGVDIVAIIERRMPPEQLHRLRKTKHALPSRTAWKDPLQGLHSRRRSAMCSAEEIVLPADFHHPSEIIHLLQLVPRDVVELRIIHGPDTNGGNKRFFNAVLQ